VFFNGPFTGRFRIRVRIKPRLIAERINMILRLKASYWYCLWRDEFLQLPETSWRWRHVSGLKAV
jgi:hypothetical protein